MTYKQLRAITGITDIDKHAVKLVEHYGEHDLFMLYDMQMLCEDNIVRYTDYARRVDSGLPMTARYDSGSDNFMTAEDFAHRVILYTALREKVVAKIKKLKDKKEYQKWQQNNQQ